MATCRLKTSEQRPRPSAQEHTHIGYSVLTQATAALLHFGQNDSVPNKLVIAQLFWYISLTKCKSHLMTNYITLSNTNIIVGCMYDDLITHRVLLKATAVHKDGSSGIVGGL